MKRTSKSGPTRFAAAVLALAVTAGGLSLAGCAGPMVAARQLPASDVLALDIPQGERAGSVAGTEAADLEPETTSRPMARANTPIGVPISSKPAWHPQRPAREAACPCCH